MLINSLERGVAQPGSASGLGPEGRRFESCHPDQENRRERTKSSRLFFVSGRGGRVRTEPRSGDAAKAALRGSTSAARWRSNPSAQLYQLANKLALESQSQHYAKSSVMSTSLAVFAVYFKVWQAGRSALSPCCRMASSSAVS